MSKDTLLSNESIQDSISRMAFDESFRDLSTEWICEASRLKYFHNLTWLGRPIIQAPMDSYAVQELVWSIRPDLIIETGIAHGGSLVLSASMLALLDYCEAAEQGLALDPRETKRHVLGIDVEIRPHNREAIESHPMAHIIEMIEGSSIDPEVVSQVKTVAKGYNKILVFLDSNHTHDHVLAELEAYAPLTSVGSYCVVWDTGIEDLPENYCSDRPWGKGNNPKTAVYEYLKSTDCFQIDEMIDHKLMITAAPDGFLRRIK
jgi:cephalosporin hydroxylase